MNIILCVPGPWTSIEALRAAVKEITNAEYLLDESGLVHSESGFEASVEFFEYEEGMAAAFKAAGIATGITPQELKEISEHQSVVYLKAEGGNEASAHSMALAAQALVKAGGLGVKVETACKAFSARLWNNLVEHFEDENLYVLYVHDCIEDEEGSVYSCGMHNLGLKDTILSGMDPEEATEIISVFGYFQLLDKPTIIENELFSEEEDSPAYLILDEPDQPAMGDELLENPYGMWRLEPTE
ncbi:MAG: hypothetical protein MUF42_01010 [Cytophagaceae bacterium]|jgi:hypothetical protein|nr:hypothetical protein [Cytophagaceae bacterium]